MGGSQAATSATATARPISEPTPAATASPLVSSIPYGGSLPPLGTVGQGPRIQARSGNSDGWAAVAGRLLRLPRDLGRPAPGLVGARAGSRLGRTHPFWWAILSPCLLTVRSTSRASGWASSSRYFSQ